MVCKGSARCRGLSADSLSCCVCWWRGLPCPGGAEPSHHTISSAYPINGLCSTHIVRWRLKIPPFPPSTGPRRHESPPLGLCSTTGWPGGAGTVDSRECRQRRTDGSDCLESSRRQQFRSKDSPADLLFSSSGLSPPTFYCSSRPTGSGDC